MQQARNKTVNKNATRAPTQFFNHPQQTCSMFMCMLNLFMEMSLFRLIVFTSTFRCGIQKIVRALVFFSLKLVCF